MPTENLRDFYIKAGVIDADPVWTKSDAPTAEGEAARAKLYAIDPDFANREGLTPRGLPTRRPITPEEKQALLDRAFEADPDDAANAYLTMSSPQQSKPRAPLTEAEKRQQRWDNAFEADPDDAANAFLAIDKERPKKEQKGSGKPTVEKKTETKKPTGKKAIPETVEEVAASKSAGAAPTKGFDQLLQDAAAGDKNAVAFITNIGHLNGFDKIQVTKDGIQYQEDGEWKTASPEEMRPMFDQAVKGIGYWQNLAAKQKGQGAQRQAPRQAIPTDLDPTVARALRAKAILKGDVGDLVAYQRMPGQIDEAAASALYRRAAAQRALRELQQGARPQVEYEYLDDGTVLEVDKNTKRRLRLFDPDQQEMPLSYINNLKGYKDAMDKILDEVEDDGGQVIRNGTMNPDIKLPNGRTMPYSQYKIAKEGGFTKGHGNVGTASTGGK